MGAPGIRGGWFHRVSGYRRGRGAGHGHCFAERCPLQHGRRQHGGLVGADGAATTAPPSGWRGGLVCAGNGEHPQTTARRSQSGSIVASRLCISPNCRRASGGDHR